MKYPTKLRIIFSTGVFSSNISGSIEENTEFYSRAINNKKNRVITIESKENTTVFNLDNVINFELSPNPKEDN